MRTPSKSPATYVCQNVITLPDGEQKICGREFTARKPTDFCPRCRKRIKNRTDQEKWRDKHKQKLDALRINQWRVLVHRLKHGKKLSQDHLFKLFHLHAHFKLPPELRFNLRIEPEVPTAAAVDFRAFTPEGKHAFTFTLMGPNSVGYWAGVRYALEIGDDEAVSAQLKEAVIRHGKRGFPMSDGFDWRSGPSYRTCLFSPVSIREEDRLRFLAYWFSHITLTLWISEKDEEAKREEEDWRAINREVWKETEQYLLGWITKEMPTEEEIFWRSLREEHGIDTRQFLEDLVKDHPIFGVIDKMHSEAVNELGKAEEDKLRAIKDEVYQIAMTRLMTVAALTIGRTVVLSSVLEVLRERNPRMAWRVEKAYVSRVVGTVHKYESLTALKKRLESYKDKDLIDERGFWIWR